MEILQKSVREYYITRCMKCKSVLKMDESEYVGICSGHNYIRFVCPACNKESYPSISDTHRFIEMDDGSIYQAD